MLKVEKINESVTYIGALDPTLKVFDIVMETKFGTTYNSYLINGGEELALVETAKEKYFDEYFENLQNICDISKIKYLIVNHTEPDHTGEVAKLLEKLPNLIIVGTPTALGFLKDISNCDFKTIEIIEKSKLKVGNKNLSFFVTPNLHWPDSMMTYLEEEKFLFTCDMFGAHYSTDKIYNDLVESSQDYKDAFKYYHDAIFGPFKGFVISGINKIKDLELNLICPSHGPILREGLDYYKEKYLEWAEDIEVIPGKISIIYTSAYGYTKRIAEEISKGVEKEGFDTILIDLLETPLEDTLVQIKSSEGYLIGSPTINGDIVPPIWNLLLSLNSYDNCGKFAGAFGAFGWSGEAVKNIEARLSMIKCEVYRPGLRIKFNPDSKEKLEECFKFGKKFAKKFAKTKKVCDDEWVQIKTGKWKCLICGEIYEGEFPPETCPACGAPSDQFVEVIDNKTSFKSEEKFKIVVLGSGVGAVSVIESIRERNSVCPIEMITEEDILPYNRILFSKQLLNKNALHLLKPQSWYEENNITISLSKKVFRINPDKSQIIFQDGSISNYDKLVIATGARNRHIPIHGDDKNGVFNLRTNVDREKIANFVEEKSVKNVVIIGGGILGVEMASELKKSNIKVTIVEFSPRIMLRQLDLDASKIFEKHLIDNKINIKKSESVEEILGTGENFNEVCSVRLSHSKEIIDCELIITSVGIEANKEIVEGSKISTNRGIIVDKYMETSIKNIFAVGDCAEFDSTLIGLWAISIDQGKVAGSNILGDKQVYRKKTIATSFNGFNYNVFSIGDLGTDPSKYYQCLELSDVESEIYKKLYFYEDEFVGGVLMGDTSKAIQLRRAIDNKSTLRHFVDQHFLNY